MPRTKKNTKKTPKQDIVFGYMWNDEREVNVVDDLDEAIEEGREMVEDSSGDDDTEYAIVYKLVPVAVIRRAVTTVEKL